MAPFLTFFASSVSSHFTLQVFDLSRDAESSDSSMDGADYGARGSNILPDRMFLCAELDSAMCWLSSLTAMGAGIPGTCGGGSNMASTPPTLTFFASSDYSHYYFKVYRDAEGSDSSVVGDAEAVRVDCGGGSECGGGWSSTIIGGDGPWFGHG